VRKLLGAALFLALANLLAVSGLIGWLFFTDRLDMDRLRSVRTMLAPTITQTKAQQAELEAKVKQAEIEAAAKARRLGAPIGVEERIELSSQQREIMAQQEARAREEARQVQLQLDNKRADLADLARKLDQARLEFQQQRERAQAETTNEQFKLAISALEAQRPADAAGVILVLVGAQPGQPTLATIPPEQLELPVRYILGLQERTRSKLLAELIKTDPRLATQLLEGIRLKGAPAPMTPGGPAGDTNAQPR